MRGVTVVLLILLATVAGGQDFDKVPVQVEPLNHTVAWVRAAGGNMLALNGPRGILLVDSDYAEMAARVDSILTADGNGPIAMVINTHWHFDHVGGNEHLARGGAVIVAHENTRRHMASPQRLAFIDTDVPASPPAAWPQICVQDRLTVNWGDEILDLLHVRGHTDTDLLVHLRTSNILHLGDLLFQGGYPYVDTEHGGNIDGLIAAVTLALSLCDEATVVVPGHGPLAGLQDLEAYLEVITEYRGLVADLKAAGQSLDEVIAAAPAAHLDAVWGQRMFPPAGMMTFIYLTLP